ncbi:MAG: HlyD family efflux transporter periplasmic adaptor subunit [Cyclobacteriaceae bacterium]|nr:HlyD family efflux transporter periplasmic adaptor subunit [Cyclobacteriaceae bacterium]
MPEIIQNKEAEIGFENLDEVSLQRSELLQDIVSNKPGLLIRWGNFFFLTIFCLVIITCWFIKYPDVIPASAKLTSINAPKPIVSLTGGKLVKLSVVELQFVNKGEIVGYLESTANHEAVLKLSNVLDTMQILLSNEQSDQIKSYFINTAGQLGELQTSYQLFLQAFLSFNNYLADGFYQKKKEMLAQDKINLEKLNQYLVDQQKLQEQDLSLAQKTFDANQSLKKENVISDFDYRLEESKLINKKLSLPQIRSALVNNENQQIEKQKEMMELENIISQQKLLFQQALNTFKSEVDEWKLRYVLTSPMDGKVAFASFIQENQQLQPNQTICYVNPENSQYFAEIVIPQANFGKVMVGQQVLLKFESYPFQEFGSVIGKIDFISHIPGEKGYLAKVSLINGLTTNYKKDVQYRDGLSATAEIITKDMRLLERFYYTFLKQVQK